MTTVVDTNVIVALWDRDDSLNLAAQRALDAARARGSLVIPAPVYAELLAFAGRTEQFLDAFFNQTSIVIDWDLAEPAWRRAGRAIRRSAMWPEKASSQVFRWSSQARKSPMPMPPSISSGGQFKKAS